jgi:hypothetical protein
MLETHNLITIACRYNRREISAPRRAAGLDDGRFPMIRRRTVLRWLSAIVAVFADTRRFDARAAVGENFKTLTPRQARVVAAIAERIWPGAESAGAVTYIDRALADAYRREARRYRIVLAQLDSAARQRFGRPFVAANGEEQDALLRDLESGHLSQLAGSQGTALFDLLRKHVMEGVLSDPIYGGNRDFAGWKAVGYPGPAREHSAEEQASMQPSNRSYHSIRDL